MLNKTNPIGYVIQAGDFDGWPDSTFSKFDMWLPTYHGPEDLRGRLGTAWDDELWKHINAEGVDGADVVMWYCAHLQHHLHDGGDEWHVCGPILVPFGY